MQEVPPLMHYATNRYVVHLVNDVSQPDGDLAMLTGFFA
jgi:hypothetical protein